MQLPDDWIEEIIARLQNSSFLIVFTNHRPEEERKEIAKKSFNEFLETPFNQAWNLNSKQNDKFREFCINICVHQSCSAMHSLTCGIGGGSHANLVPRINSDDECYLVCPTCGWIQKSSTIPYWES